MLFKDPLHPILRNEEISIHRRKFKSKYNAPNLGEFNNGKVSPYIEPNPLLETRFKNGVIYIYTESRIKRGNNRRTNFMTTKYDCRNDPAWHVKNKQAFVLGPIVTNGEEKREVPSLNDLQLVNENGEPVTQEFLEEHLGYLNGASKIGIFTSSTTMHRASQGQKNVTKTKNKYADISADMPVDEFELRARRRVLDSFDRQLLQVKLSKDRIKN